MVSLFCNCQWIAMARELAHSTVGRLIFKGAFAMRMAVGSLLLTQGCWL
jgi:hypothetical protein